jgi:hypothetical protein
MTVIFETVLGHYVLEGRVWPLVLLWLTSSPYVFYKIDA